MENRDPKGRKEKLFAMAVSLSEQERCEIFDTGVFNEICKAYTFSALERCGMGNDAAKVLHELEADFENTAAGEALSFYRTT